MVTNLVLVLIPILWCVESGCSVGDIIGDNGRAAGPLQIHKICIDDVNRIYHTSYRWPEDAYDLNTSFEICYKYLSHYGNIYYKQHGTIELSVLARIWNGGPNGWRKKATEKYWLRVQEKMRGRT